MSNIIMLDFIERDSIEALKFLTSKFERDEASGLIFGLKLKHVSRPCFTGATGTLASNFLEGAGIASLVHLQMVQYAMSQT